MNEFQPVRLTCHKSMSPDVLSVGACALIKKQETDLLFIVVLLYIELLSRTFDSVFHARVLSSVSLFLPLSDPCESS